MAVTQIHLVFAFHGNPRPEQERVTTAGSVNQINSFVIYQQIHAALVQSLDKIHKSYRQN